jgi:Rha family phage regulatory protein
MEPQHSRYVLNSGKGNIPFLFIVMFNNIDNHHQTNNSSLMATLIHDTDRMSSLEIAELTGKLHKNVLADIRNLLSQGVTKLNFQPSTYKDPTGRKLPCFELTKKGCLILASGYDAVLREKIIDRWEQLELEKRKPQTPQTYLEALKALVSSEEEKQRLAQEKKQLEEKNAKLQPKADFADAAFATDDKVDIGMSAKILKLGFGRNTLFEKLRKAGVFFANRNEPKQRFIDAGYFEMKEKFIERTNHPGFVVTKVLVTQKGLAYLNHLFGGKPSDGKLARIV